MTTVFRTTALSLLAFTFGATTVFAQTDDPQDIVAAARNARAPKPIRAKIVVTDDDISSAHSPFPELDLKNPKDAESILKSVQEFKASHTPEETEQAVRLWFQQNDNQIESLLSQVKSLTAEEREKAEQAGQPVPDVVKQSDELQEQLRRVLDALKSTGQDDQNSRTQKLPKDLD